MSSLAHCYVVCSPEYGEVIPILDDGTGPMEYGCDVVFAFTRNARRAKVLGVRWFRRRGARYLRYAENPFAGVKAERLEFCERCHYANYRTRCNCCDACEGTGNGAIHGVEGQCSACNGTGRLEEAL